MTRLVRLAHLMVIVLAVSWSPAFSASSGHTHAHAAHDHTAPLALPQTRAEADAFVAAVRAKTDTHTHDESEAKAAEHMAAMGLVPRDDATHIAIAHGRWFDPAVWYGGEVPGADARVLIPAGVHVTYDEVAKTRLFTVRVDGHLEFSPEVSSKILLDTMVVAPGGHLVIGTIERPVDPDVTVDIVFTNNGPIDTDWDPMLLSRGLIAHGTTRIHGTPKLSHAKVVVDPLRGHTSVDFAELPEGWRVGDTIVIAGTRYDGYKWDNDIRAKRHYPSEDEVRVITDLEDTRVQFRGYLLHSHAGLRPDLKTSVANLTRNVTFYTEDLESAEVYERAHVMFMHSDDVDVRYAAFHGLGRTDKSQPARNVSEFRVVGFDTNAKGRYSFHFHRTGVGDPDRPGMAVGNAVWGSPGWGYVHHDSNAVFHQNASFDTFGAGYVAESGNEIGAWTDNIAIYAKGVSWAAPKNGNDVKNFDLGKTGDGFWFQSRMVASTGNTAASVNRGFVYFHRGPGGENGQILFDARVSPIAEALHFTSSVHPEKAPILSFSSNEAFAAREGLHVVKANPNQRHDIHTILEGFTAWSVISGAHFEYTSHYIIRDFDIVGKLPVPFSKPRVGISFGQKAFDMVVVSPRVSGFEVGIDLEKEFESMSISASLHDYVVLDSQFHNVGIELESYDPLLDDVLTSDALPRHTPDLELNGPLFYERFQKDWSDRVVRISGTKTDSLGTKKFPSGTDDFNVRSVQQILEQDGYWTTSDGRTYFLLNIYFTDRLTGHLYFETHPVFLKEKTATRLRSPHFEFEDAIYNGQRDLSADELDQLATPVMWATLGEELPLGQ